MSNILTIILIIIFIIYIIVETKNNKLQKRVITLNEEIKKEIKEHTELLTKNRKSISIISDSKALEELSKQVVKKINDDAKLKFKS